MQILNTQTSMNDINSGGSGYPVRVRGWGEVSTRSGKRKWVAGPCESVRRSGTLSVERGGGSGHPVRVGRGKWVPGPYERGGKKWVHGPSLWGGDGKWVVGSCERGVR